MPLEEQQVFLTAEPSLQSLRTYFEKKIARRFKNHTVFSDSGFSSDFEFCDLVQVTEATSFLSWFSGLCNANGQ